MMKTTVYPLFFLALISCGTAPVDRGQDMDDWKGKTKKEVDEAFARFTPKSEGNKVTYKDRDPLPTNGRCSVVPCGLDFPGKRIDCTYVFEFKDDRVTRATRSGKCRN